VCVCLYSYVAANHASYMYSSNMARVGHDCHYIGIIRGNLRQPTRQQSGNFEVLADAAGCKVDSGGVRQPMRGRDFGVLTQMHPRLATSEGCNRNILKSSSLPLFHRNPRFGPIDPCPAARRSKLWCDDVTYNSYSVIEKTIGWELG